MSEENFIPNGTMPDDAWVDEFGVTYSADRKTLIHAGQLACDHYTVPDNVTHIKAGAFFCYGIRSIVIPQSVTSISGMAFNLCDGLTDVKIEGNNFIFEQGMILSYDRTTIIRYLASNTEAHYVIPDTICRIGEGAFSGCNFLRSVVIGDSVKSIDSGAFAWCLKMESVVIVSQQTQVEENAFTMCLKIKSFTQGAHSANKWGWPYTIGGKLVKANKHFPRWIKYALAIAAGILILHFYRN